MGRHRRRRSLRQRTPDGPLLACGREDRSAHRDRQVRVRRTNEDPPDDGIHVVATPRPTRGIPADSGGRATMRSGCARATAASRSWCEPADGTRSRPAICRSPGLAVVTPGAAGGRIDDSGNTRWFGALVHRDWAFRPSRPGTNWLGSAAGARGRNRCDAPAPMTSRRGEHTMPRFRDRPATPEAFHSGSWRFLGGIR